MDSLSRLASMFLAWLGPALCVVVAGFQARKLARHAPPARAELVNRLALLATAAERAELRQELREERRNAERALGLALLWPHSLSRVSLATGTALAVATLAQRGGSPAAHVLSACVQFVGGFAGMAGCAIFGRQAKGVAAELRRSWRETLEMAARE